jgi:hypothetical protein
MSTIFIVSKLKTHQKTSETIDETCNQISLLADNALLPSSTNISTKLKSMNDPVATGLSNLIALCNNHLNILNSELEILKKEDSIFHSEETDKEDNYGF